MWHGNVRSTAPQPLPSVAMAQKLHVESLSRPLSKQQILSGTNACEHTFVRVHPSNKGTSPADSETHSIVNTCCSSVCQGSTVGVGQERWVQKATVHYALHGRGH
jgi:hypothetical protein